MSVILSTGGGGSGGVAKHMYHRSHDEGDLPTEGSVSRGVCQGGSASSGVCIQWSAIREWGRGFGYKGGGSAPRGKRGLPTEGEGGLPTEGEGGLPTGGEGLTTGGGLPGGLYLEGSASRGRGPACRGLCHPPAPRWNWKSGRYVSYWKAFLFF